MSNGDRPAFVPMDNARDRQFFGLTKREYFAAMAMQGLLANPSIDELSSEEIAADSILFSDALLKALEEK